MHELVVGAQARSSGIEVINRHGMHFLQNGVRLVRSGSSAARSPVCTGEEGETSRREIANWTAEEMKGGYGLPLNAPEASEFGREQAQQPNFYSITWSARTSSVRGTSGQSALTV